MKEKIRLLRKMFSQYRKAVMDSVGDAFVWLNLLVVLPTIYKIKSLEIGEYPEEPKEVVRAHLQEMRPVILRDAAVRYLLLFILLFLIYLVYRLKQYYNIDLMGKLVDRIRKKDSREA